MALETVTHISDLVATNPTSTDPKSEGDNHLRNIKTALKTDFPNISGVVTKTHTQLNNTLDKTGDTMTGNLNVPSLNTGQLAGFRNKIINGKMEVGQRGTSFPAIVSGAYSVDRWIYAAVTSGVVTASRSTDVPSSNEFQNSLRLEVTTADASIAATDVVFVAQLIEGYNARDLIGRTCTASFWVRSSKTGVHCVSLSNNDQDRSYVVEYTINAANTWEFKTATFPGGLITAGTWNWTDGIGVRLRFALAAGANFQTTAGAWQTGAFTATANQVNCLDTVGNIFAITGVQLEVGSVATPFEHRPYGMELALCQRYYYRETPTAADQTLGVGHNTLTTAAVATSTFPVQMRSSPTALEQSGTAGDYSVAHANTNTACSAVPTFLTASPFAATTTLTVAAGLTAGQGSRARAVNTSAYLAWSAEL